MQSVLAEDVNDKSCFEHYEAKGSGIINNVWREASRRTGNVELLQIARDVISGNSGASTRRQDRPLPICEGDTPKFGPARLTGDEKRFFDVKKSFFESITATDINDNMEINRLDPCAEFLVKYENNKYNIWDIAGNVNHRLLNEQEYEKSLTGEYTNYTKKAINYTGYRIISANKLFALYLLELDKNVGEDSIIVIEGKRDRKVTNREAVEDAEGKVANPFCREVGNDKVLFDKFSNNKILRAFLKLQKIMSFKK